METNSAFQKRDVSKNMEDCPSLLETARLAYDLTNAKWETLNSPTGKSDSVCYSDDASVIVDRVYAIILIRVLALVCSRSRTTIFCAWSRFPWFLDLSTSTICHTLLTKKDKHGDDWEWPVAMNPQFMVQLKDYISKIVSLYRDVPYHNFEHAYHVFISANKLLDLVLCKCHLPPLPCKNQHTNESNGTNNCTFKSSSPQKNQNGRNGSEVYEEKPFRPTYGIKRDPLIQLAFLFSALVHDAEHSGVTNRQLVLEGDKLAIMYNDQSVAEQRSLALAFSIIRESQYSSVRKLLFEHGEDGKRGDSYTRFRSTVIDLVLCTDIASPERVQIVKSKWKEVFGDAHKRTSVVRANGIKRRRNPNGRQSLSAADAEGLGRNLKTKFMESRPSLSPCMTYAEPSSTQDCDSCSSSSSAHESETTQTTDNNHFINNNANVDDKLNSSSRKRARSSFVETVNVDIKQKRMSLPVLSCGRKAYQDRLGIRRTVDLDGRAIEPFRGSQTLGHMVGDLDQPNDLKLIVVLEQMIKAADISTNLQCWDNMTWSSHRLFKEQRMSFNFGRGDDPAPGWFDNQKNFIESYALPLAHRLVEAGVFQEDFGLLLVNCVEKNRARWLEEGRNVCIRMFADR